MARKEYHRYRVTLVADHIKRRVRVEWNPNYVVMPDWMGRINYGGERASVVFNILRYRCKKVQRMHDKATDRELIYATMWYEDFCKLWKECGGRGVKYELRDGKYKTIVGQLVRAGSHE